MSKPTQDPQKCKYCFMSGTPPFPTCQKNFIDSIDADNTCILWRCRDYCLDFTPNTKEVTIEGWVAVDDDGGCYLHTQRPRVVNREFCDTWEYD